MTAHLHKHYRRPPLHETSSNDGYTPPCQADTLIKNLRQKELATHSFEGIESLPETPKGSHWSIAWSDLMMTMFILFLSLFVYQAVHKDLLVKEKTEVVAGKTIEAFDVKEPESGSLPFNPIPAGPPLMVSGTIRKVEPVYTTVNNLQPDFVPFDSDKTIAELASIIPDSDIDSVPIIVPTEIAKAPEVKPAVIEQNTMINVAVTATENEIYEPEIYEPQPLKIVDNTTENVNTLYSEGKKILEKDNLNQIASIELVPDQAVRIVLTGDLLFRSGDASLSGDAMSALKKIATALHNSSDQIHIEGHTDNTPILKGEYANNWELSLARAHAVAAFLIEDMNMDPKQFVVSGFSSYRPVAPNTSISTRAANRRVEIIVKKKEFIEERITSNLSYLPNKNT